MRDEFLRHEEHILGVFLFVRIFSQLCCPLEHYLI